jgi:hypothetical protein
MVALTVATRVALAMSACLIACSPGEVEASTHPSAADWDQIEIENQDWTEDMQHRTKAGLFLPSREPVICFMRGEKRREALIDHPMMVRCEHGSMVVRTNAAGIVVFFFVGRMADAHPRLAAPMGGLIVRQFSEVAPFPVPSASMNRKSRAVGAPVRFRSPLRVGDLVSVLDGKLGEFEIVVCGENGRPVPYALLRVTTEDVGGFAFQADCDGLIRMSFLRDWRAMDAKVDVGSIREGSVMGRREFSDMYTGLLGWSLEVSLTRVEEKKAVEDGRKAR